MIGHTLISISSAQGAWAITTLGTWGYGQKGSDPLRRIFLYPKSTLGESSLPSTTCRLMILSAVFKGGSCGGNKSSPIPRACDLPRVNNLVFGHPIESFPNGLKGTVAGPIPY
jgi:hypothetical protein